MSGHNAKDYADLCQNCGFENIARHGGIKIEVVTSYLEITRKRCNVFSEEIECGVKYSI